MAITAETTVISRIFLPKARTYVILLLSVFLQLRSCAGWTRPLTRMEFLGALRELSVTQLQPIIAIPLVFLPRAGCLAIQVSLQDGAYEYYAVVDTGSPFLTAPSEALYFSYDKSDRFPASAEQYGESIGNMRWRESSVSLCSPASERLKPRPVCLQRPRAILGVPPRSVLEDTGGLFCGLIADDDARPTFLGQFNMNSFQLDWKKRLLTLGNSGTTKGAEVLDVYDLSPFGPNLHHYGVECAHVEFMTEQGSLVLTPKDLSRPVVVVVDSGLTGCILSDSWLEESAFVSRQELATIKGAAIRLNGKGQEVKLTSQPEYWFLSCFRLPWFTDEKNHPHILAAGATFLNGSRVGVDAKARKLSIIYPD